MVLGLFNLVVIETKPLYLAILCSLPPLSLFLPLPLSHNLFELHLSVSFLFLLLLLEQHIPLSISDGDAGWVIFALVQLFQRRSLFFLFTFFLFGLCSTYNESG